MTAQAPTQQYSKTQCVTTDWTSEWTETDRRYLPHSENISELQESRINENRERIFLEKPGKSDDGFTLLPEFARPEA